MTRSTQFAVLIPDHTPPSSPYFPTSYRGKTPSLTGTGGPLWESCPPVRSLLPRTGGRGPQVKSFFICCILFLVVFIDAFKTRAGRFKILLCFALVWIRVLEDSQYYRAKGRGFPNQALESHLQNRWPNTICSEDLRNTTGMSSMKETIYARRCRRCGHVCSILSSSLPQTALQWTPQWKRNRATEIYVEADHCEKSEEQKTDPRDGQRAASDQAR